MTNLINPGEDRSAHVNSGGNDDNIGSTYNQPYLTIDKAISDLLGLIPPPAPATPAALVVLGGDNLLDQQLNNLDSIIGLCDGLSITATTVATIVELGSFANLTLLTAFSLVEDGVAVLAEDVTRSGFDFKFAHASGAGSPISIHIKGTCDQLFLTGGQVAVSENGYGILDESANTLSVIYRPNLVSMEGSNCVGFCNDGAGSVKVLEFAVITNQGAVSGNKGIWCKSGETIASGPVIDTDEAIVVESGSELSINATDVSGDIIVEAGGTMNVEITNHRTGGLSLLGVVNGNIDGTRYGTWIEGVEHFVNMFRGGGIPGSWDNFGQLTLDAAIYQLVSVECSFVKTTGASRTIGFRLVDADSSDVYFSGSVVTTSTGLIDVSTSVVTAFPVTGDIRMFMQVERTAGGFSGVSDASANIVFEE